MADETPNLKDEFLTVQIASLEETQAAYDALPEKQKRNLIPPGEWKEFIDELVNELKNPSPGRPGPSQG